ncbi:MAG: hypothetical protein K2G85_02130 [Muribaculaceae bacterium]|nr:hypothetical protein [Muribaculaceae bacterium]
MIKFTKKKFTMAFVAALALISNVAMGQDIKVTTNGKDVVNNGTYEVECTVEDYSEYGAGIYYAWYPHIEVASLSGEMPIKVTMSAAENTDYVQFCWPYNCQYSVPGGSVSAEGTIGTTPQDLQIHGELNSLTTSVLPKEAGEIKVQINYNFKSFEFTVKFLPAPDAAVSVIDEDANVVPQYYTIDGYKVDSPSKGLYVVKKGKNSQLKVIK